MLYMKAERLLAPYSRVRRILERIFNSDICNLLQTLVPAPGLPAWGRQRNIYRDFTKDAGSGRKTK